jgi:hypothetical protein
MPSSSHVHVSRMLDHIVRLQPQSILDVGIGFGKWGFLCREFLDVAHGRYAPGTWTTRIDGIEAHQEYRNVIHEQFYNRVFYSMADDVVPSLGEYDLVIIADVIEHLDKANGHALLAQLRKHGKYVLVSSPVWFFQQGHEENPYQEHRSLWGINDFTDYRFEYDEYLAYIFVALIEGELPHDFRLDSRPSRLAYRWKYIRQHPKAAVLLKSLARKALSHSTVGAPAESLTA